MKTYLLDDKQEEFIKRLLTENFSPSFGGMLKRILREKEYNETERTRIKEIRLSYIKKKIVPRDKWKGRFASQFDEVTLMNKKLQCTNMLFKKYNLDERIKRLICGKFDKVKTNEELVDLYNYYIKQLK